MRDKTKIKRQNMTRKLAITIQGKDVYAFLLSIQNLVLISLQFP